MKFTFGFTNMPIKVIDIISKNVQFRRNTDTDRALERGNKNKFFNIYSYSLTVKHCKK